MKLFTSEIIIYLIINIISSVLISNRHSPERVTCPPVLMSTSFLHVSPRNVLSGEAVTDENPEDLKSQSCLKPQIACCTTMDSKDDFTDLLLSEKSLLNKPLDELYCLQAQRTSRTLQIFTTICSGTVECLFLLLPHLPLPNENHYPLQHRLFRYFLVEKFSG